MKQEFELKLQAWLDGELSATEAQHIDREVAGNAEAGRLVAGLRSIKSAMAGNELAVALPETREFYWSKIERQILRDTRRPSPVQSPRPAGWRRWLSPLAGIAGLACMLLLAFKPFSPAGSYEVSSTGEGMEAVSFNDQSAGMTVIWLADSEQFQPIEIPDARVPDNVDPEVEM